MRSGTMTACALLVCACAGEDTEHHPLNGLVVAHDFDETICAGTFSSLERRLDATMETVAVAAARWWRCVHRARALDSAQ